METGTCKNVFFLPLLWTETFLHLGHIVLPED
jgi:hypothetical protein